MANVGTGVTIGNHALRAVKLRRKGEQYVVQRVFADRLDEDTARVAGRALAAKGFKGAPATVGLTGRDVIIRYTQIPPVPEWRLRTLMKFEVEEVSAQSGGDVSADYRKLELPDPDGTRDDDTVLVALARNRQLDRMIKSLGAGGLKLAAGTPNSVALFNAFAINATYREDETSLLVNIGGENVDIALQRGGELLFARNATPGGKAFTEAIAQAFGTTPGKAEKMKKTKGDVTPKGQAKYPDPTSEKVANAIIGVAGQLSSLIQSTLMIAKAQTRVQDLRVDRVLLTGGGASLKGIDLYLKQAIGVPVERFNPFEICDLSGLSPEEQELVEAAPHEFAVAVGLAQNELSPAAFELHVLPEGLRKARDFATKGIWAAAAALVAVGVLFLLYKSRSDSAAEIEAARRKIKTEKSRVQKDDGRLRGVLSTTQQAEVKHLLLAQRADPGAFFGKVLAEIEAHAHEQIYMHQVRLQLDKAANVFPYLIPKRSDANGYEPTTRSYDQIREAYVTIDARVSGGENPSRIAENFIQALQDNERGLIVDTERLFRAGSGGKPGTFRLIVRPGHVIEPATEEGRRIVLRQVRFEAAEEGESPEAILGRRADGVLVRVAREDVKGNQWDELEAQLRR